MKSIKSTSILIIDNSSAITGAFRSITSLVKVLPTSIKVHFALNAPMFEEELEYQGFRTHHVPFFEIHKSFKLFFYFPLLLLNTYRVLRIIKQEKMDVLHVNDLYNMIGVLVKIFKPGIKLVYHVRLLPDSYARVLYRFWVKAIIRFGDHIICVSKAVYNALPNTTKKRVIYDSLPAVPKVEKQKNARFTFLYIGNYICGKGQNFAVEAFASQQELLKDAQLVFVGGDMGLVKNIAFKNELIESVKQKGLEEDIQFIDFMRDLSPMYQKAHVVLNFSESESFSMVCLESLINGTPVIATKCGGPEEIINHNQNGMLVSNRNIEEMGNAMVTIYQNQELRESMESKTIPITSKFSIDESSIKLEEVYLN